MTILAPRNNVTLSDRHSLYQLSQIIINLLIVHLVAGEVDLGWSVDGDGEGSRAHAGGVDDEGRPLAGRAALHP